MHTTYTTLYYITYTYIQARIAEPERMPIAKKWLCKYVPAVTNTCIYNGRIVGK
jgi:hypothetical protein